MYRKVDGAAYVSVRRLLERRKPAGDIDAAPFDD
jgi:hypothetical protein